MSTLVNSDNQKIWGKLASLKKISDKSRKKALKNRIIKHSPVSDFEYLLGAFIEMYDPYLTQIVSKFSEKGYALDPSSGFSGKFCEFQVISGYFPIDYITRNKLEKIGVKMREHHGSKSLIFWPEKPSLDEIKTKWMQIIDILPDKGVLKEPTNSPYAIAFRRKYVPKDPNLQKKRLFERLQYSTQRKIDNDVKLRKTQNPHPNNLESRLGFFIEELEPQVREAVLKMNKKGYSTDVSGFMDNTCEQMIEGDFLLEEKSIKKLEAFGVTVETNPSGYTRLQFIPGEADIKKIKKQWDKIVSLLPDKKRIADASMTRQAREFRVKYS